MATPQDDRPSVAAGHILMSVRNVADTTDFFETMGLRRVTRRDTFSVLELRGGTHLVVGTRDDEVEPGTVAPIDLMVDDLEATHAFCAAEGMAPTEITSGSVHSSFYLDRPDGYRVKVTSSHTGGRAV